jgi:hypothetical protein
MLTPELDGACRELEFGEEERFRGEEEFREEEESGSFVNN